ncbi:MAG: TraR/DksA family transcriptional regulator [Sciscionella sp.]
MIEGASGVAAELIEARRAETLRRVASLTSQVDAIVESSEWTTNDDEHDPEGSTVAFERAQLQGLLARARDEIRELDHATQRLADGCYGACERCGGAIAEARLEALPAARTCITCANKVRR